MPNTKRVMMGAAGVPTGPGAGSLFGWGKGDNGVLAQNIAYTGASSPVQIGALTNWAKVSASRSALAVKTDGTLWSWGVGSFGQLGLGTSGINGSSPVQVGSLTTWSKPYKTSHNGFVIKTDGTLWGWGYDGKGNMGVNTTGVHVSSPVQIGSVDTWASFTKMGTSEAHGGILTSGKLYTWGRNEQGGLGHGDKINKSVPTQVGSLTNWASLSMNTSATGAVKTDGTLWTWGGENLGALGHNVVISKSSPVQVGSLTNWAKISMGSNHTVAVKTDGTLWTWGFGNYGLGGQGTTDTHTSSPIQVGSLTTWSDAQAFTNWTLARKTDGTLWSWGQGAHGRLGLGDTINVSSPTQVGTGTYWSSNFSGRYVAMVITE
mgnify:CR=1 FL=1